MNLFIDRIELTLDGVSSSDARLLSTELPAALETRLGVAGSGAGAADASPDDTPLETALRGRALVDAIAARLVDAIGDERRRAAEASAASATHGAALASGGHRETTWL